MPKVKNPAPWVGFFAMQELVNPIPSLKEFLQQHGCAAQQAPLKTYAALLKKWNPTINLVAPATLPQVETRHLLDSAQLLPLLPAHPVNILDVGSGAGLPGLVLALLLPRHAITLAERDQRKAAFLHTAKHALGLTNVTIHAGDVRELATRALRYDIITGRAFTETANFISMTAPLLVPGGSWLLLKGEAVSQELHDLSGMTISRTPSITAANSWVVRLTPAL